MMGLPDGVKSFKIGLAVLIQYRRVTDTQPASHVAVASTALTTSRCSRTTDIAPGNMTMMYVVFLYYT